MASSSSSSSCGRLKGHVAVVTGGSSGIGAEIARTLASEGACVAVGARRVEQLQHVKEDIERHLGQCVAFYTDVTNRKQVKALVAAAQEKFGDVTIMVNNAGMMPFTFMKNLHEDEWEAMVDVNCKGLLHGIGAVLDGMLSRGKGHIINISSDAGRKVFPGLAVYSGTKYFVEAVSRGLRAETAGSGIRVTCIQPGDVKTELAATTTDSEAMAAVGDVSKVKVLEPRNIANAVIYAITQPNFVAVNEILIEPTECPI